MKVTLKAESLEKVFPFHVAFDKSLQIIHIGRSLRKLLKQDPLGLSLQSVFKLSQPKIPLNIENLANNLDREFFFKIIETDILLRGELTLEEDVFIFLGGPWVTTMKQVEDLGLSAKDFSIHDPSLHYFSVIQQHQNALVEAHQLTQKLIQQGKDLKQKEEQLSMALEGSQDGIWDWRIDNNDFYYSPRLIEMLGFQYGEVRPNFHAIEKLINDEDSLHFDGALENHFRYGESFDIECRWRTKSGGWKWILTRGKVVEWDSEGNPLRMVGLNSDIDERKISEEELKNIHARLIDAIEIIDSGFVIFDKKERLLICNTKYKNMYLEASNVMIPGTPYDMILDELVKQNVPEKSGVEPETWIAHKLAFHRRPGVDREERLKNMWVRISERRTAEGGVVSLLTDITERVNQEDALRRYVEIVQSTYEGILSFDLQGVILSWNPACYDIFGFTPQEAVGQHISCIFPDHLVHEMTEILENLRQGLSIERQEATRIKKSGEEVYVSQSISPILDIKDKIIGASCVVQDITAKRKIEEEVKKRDQLLQGINLALHYLLTEENFLMSIGLAIDRVGEALDVDALTVQFQDLKQNVNDSRFIWTKSVKRTSELLEIPADWIFELEKGLNIRKQATFTEVEKSIFQFKDTETILVLPLNIEGRYSGFILIEKVGVKRDWEENEISLLNAFSYAIGGSFAKELAEEQLRESEQKFRRVFDTSKDGIIAVSQKGLVTMFNPAAEKMFLRPYQDAIGKKLETFFPREYLEEEKGFIIPKGFDKKDVQEIYALKGNGKTFPVEISVSLEDALDTNFTVGIVRDITERKQVEHQLAVAREKEIDIGFRIQHALLLGKPPENLKGISVALVTIASQGIDGDFYDFFPHGRHEFDMLIGDVMGKGIPAALLGAATKSAFNHAITTLTTTSKGKLPEPSEIMSFVHDQITSQMIELESFMTIFFARIDNVNKQMIFVDCGHTSTMHYKKKEKEIELLKGTNVPLGFLENEEYHQKSINFDAGDVFLFYSDGVTEAKDKNDRFYGVEQLQKMLKTSAHLNADNIVKEITRSVEAFTESSVFSDDLTCIVVKIEEKSLQLEYLETVQLPKKLDHLQNMRRAIIKFCERSHHFKGQLRVIELELAANEVYTNIVRHSVGHQEVKIEMILEMYSDRIRIHFDYFGQRFAPSNVELPHYDTSQQGGFGLYIIQMMVDDVVYLELESGKQRITLTKYLS